MKHQRSPLDRRPLLLGVVHLLPLPGAPGAVGGRDRPWLTRAVADARVLAKAGFDGVVVENHGDAPFFRGSVPPSTVAALTTAASAVRDALPAAMAVGVNVLRNDAAAAIAIAAAADLDFVRVNILQGAMVTDQGLIEGDAARVLRDRAALAPRVRILGDVRVKHAAPLAPRPIADEARDLLGRGGADALIVTGGATGSAVDPDRLRQVREACPDALILVGSGATKASVAALLQVADGVIVGTSIKRKGQVGEAVDLRRARAFVEAARGGAGRD